MILLLAVLSRDTEHEANAGRIDQEIDGHSLTTPWRFGDDP